MKAIHFAVSFPLEADGIPTGKSLYIELEAKQTPTKKTFKLLLISFKAKLLCANDFE